MNNKYLLYIDILGFSDLVKSNSITIDQLYNAIDKLNVHRHNAFKTIVFSDTILVINKDDPTNEHDHEYLIMYFCEFVQDLQKWCIKLNVQFRAILLNGQFDYQKKENIEAYYGDALISAYYKEKEVIGMGLFISNKINSKNKIFKSVPFDKELDFVFLTQNLDELIFLSNGEIPINRALLEESQTMQFLWLEIEMLKDLKKKSETFSDSRVRAKYVVTYHLYRSKYLPLVEQFEKHGFDINTINNEVNWAELSVDWWPL